MPKLSIQKDDTEQFAQLYIRDSSELSEVVGLSGLVFDTTGLTCRYMRGTAAAPVVVPLVDMVLGTHVDGGFVAVDDANIPGLYMFGIPDAALVGGADSVVFVFAGAANMEALPMEIELVDAVTGSLLGSGADNVTITITDGTGVVPDADVWITSDAVGAVVVAGTLQTNSMGQRPFLLDRGSTYYLWMQKDGVNPILGEKFVAVED